MDRREEFIYSIMSLCGVKESDRSNAVTYDFIYEHIAWVKEEWFLELMACMTTTQTNYKTPLEIFSNAVKEFKKIKFSHLFFSIDKSLDELKEKLLSSFLAFKELPKEYEVTTKMFVNPSDDTPFFTEKQTKIINFAGGWVKLYELKDDGYLFVKRLKDAYDKAIENYIKETTFALGTAPVIELKKYAYKEEAEAVDSLFSRVNLPIKRIS